VGADDAVDDGPADLVVDGLLLVGCRGDEELQRSATALALRQVTNLVLNVDKVASVLDGLDVGVGDRVLGADAQRPLAATVQLARPLGPR
jgi:hypothetical protein